MAWIKVENCTPDKPEIFRIADQLDIDPDAALGKLIRVWIWADSQTYDGNAYSVTQSLIDRVAGVTGFASAMIRAGWLSEIDGGFVFVNFDRHNGQTAKTRALTSKRVQKHRNATSVTSALPEKRREEKSKDPPVVPQGTSTDFDRFWEVVHRREGKGKAKKAFTAAIKRIRGEGRESPADYLIERMRLFAASPQARDEVRGKLHPATWLNQGRYDDDDAVWQQNGNGKPFQQELMTTEELEAWRPE